MKVENNYKMIIVRKLNDDKEIEYKKMDCHFFYIIEFIEQKKFSTSNYFLNFFNNLFTDSAKQKQIDFYRNKIKYLIKDKKPDNKFEEEKPVDDEAKDKPLQTVNENDENNQDPESKPEDTNRDKEEIEKKQRELKEQEQREQERIARNLKEKERLEQEDRMRLQKEAEEKARKKQEEREQKELEIRQEQERIDQEKRDKEIKDKLEKDKLDKLEKQKQLEKLERERIDRLEREKLEKLEKDLQHQKMNQIEDLAYSSKVEDSQINRSNNTTNTEPGLWKETEERIALIDKVNQQMNGRKESEGLRE